VVSGKGGQWRVAVVDHDVRRLFWRQAAVVNSNGGSSRGQWLMTTFINYFGSG
jgi:hypothetical protein